MNSADESDVRAAMTTRARCGATLLPCLLVCIALCLAGCNAGKNDGAGRDAAAAMPGKTIYERTCYSCHSTGAAGAPRVGDATAWAPRIAKGRAALVQSVQHGVPPGMPPKGLCPTCSDEELGQALDYRLAKSR